MENSFIVLIHWWTGWLDMAFLWIPVGLISPHTFIVISIKGSIREINHLLIGDPYRRWNSDGCIYSVIAVWIREVWSG
jgi:hypothetical protein